MSRFVRQATDAGVITPRSAPLPAPPRRYLTAARLLGATGMIVLTALLYWLLTDASFRVTEDQVSFEGLRYADEEDVRAHLSGLDRSPNVFRVRASEIVGRLQELPEVSSARAIVTLPAGVTVHVEEREPVFVWSDGRRSWLVDREGMLFAPATEVSELAPDTPAPEDTSTQPALSDSGISDSGISDSGTSDSGTSDGGADGTEADDTADGSLIEGGGAGLPRVDDSRLLAEPPTVGSRLPPADLLVMRRLLALTPELLGSRAEALWLRVDQYDGYVLQSDRGWQAIFGNYSPSLQPPEVVDRQVQCLQWLLAAEERRLERVRLNVAGGDCGTFSRLGG